MHCYGKIAIGLLFLGCTAFDASGQNDARAGKAGPGRELHRYPDHVEFYSGDVLIRTDGARIFVMVDTVKDDSGGGMDGLVDQWFTLQGDEPFVMPVFAHVPAADIVHWPGALRVTSGEAQTRFEFVLSDADRDTPVPHSYGATRVAGVGLSHNIGDTNIHIASQLDRGRVTTNCPECGPLEIDPGGGGNDAAGCVSGGSGASACSTGLGGAVCSISCVSGYYACCNSIPGFASCKCVKNP